MQRSTVSVIAALFISMGTWSPAGAETTPKNAIKFRQAVMDAMLGHTSAFSMIAFGMVDHQEYLQSHADALATTAAQIKVLFPDGSGGEESDALPTIWEEPDEFSAAVAKAEKATADLRDAAASGDRKAIASAFKGVGQACKGCHERYRVEHEH